VNDAVVLRIFKGDFAGMEFFVHCQASDKRILARNQVLANVIKQCA
jgi:hypothetical protein